MSAAGRSPSSAVVIGAGMVGLSVAWFLQEAGIEVTVVERDEPASGSSWGNAGWLSPGLAVPLPEPAVLRYGLRSLADRRSALFIPPALDFDLWRFLARFARHCTLGRWREAMRSYLAMNEAALAAYDRLSDGGVPAETIEAPILAAFTDRAEAAGLRRELDMMAEAGQHLEVVELDAAGAREAVPQLSWRVGHALELRGQRYIDPGRFVGGLAKAVSGRGGTLLTGSEVTGILTRPGGVTVTAAGEQLRADVAVLATGAWLDRLARPFGVRVQVRAGRGYSFSVRTARPVPCPVYFPLPRVACTPYQGGLRVGGTMEFRPVDAPLRRDRMEALLASAQPLLAGIDWDSVTDTWVGSRPVTPDGLALVGVTGDPAVFVAGGHGMWGITLGPITGQLLAEQIVTGSRPAALAAFDPRR
jgi:D-amino-acid dehydrogenase